MCLKFENGPAAQLPDIYLLNFHRSFCAKSENVCRITESNVDFLCLDNDSHYTFADKVSSLTAGKSAILGVTLEHSRIHTRLLDFLPQMFRSFSRNWAADYDPLKADLAGLK